MAKSNQDKYKAIADRIIEKLKEGTVPWRKTWSQIAVGWPQNHFSGHVYQGINTFLLSDFDVPRFCTYKQAKDAGTHVKRGAKGHHVYYWDWIYYDKNKKKTTDRLKAAIKIPFLKGFTVFNILDVEGFSIDDFDKEEAPVKIETEACEKILRDNPHRLIHGDPAYIPSNDAISMPRWDEFESMPAYYHTYFHELAHWTGHSTRLKRVLKGRSDLLRYSYEELIAEMSAHYLCVDTGIVIDELFENTSSYIQSWISTFQNDPSILIRAAGTARKVVSYLCPKEERNCDVTTNQIGSLESQHVER